MAPAVSVIIVTYNSARTIGRCLAALNHQTSRDFEIIVIDNASADGGPDEADLPENARLIRNAENTGFAAACNQGARMSQARWVAMINPDAYADPKLIETWLDAAARLPDFRMLGALQLMADNPDMMDGAGDVYHASGLAWRGGHGKPAAIAPMRIAEIFGPCGAAALYDREAFLRVGGFDERYFCYFEDVDLALRLRLTGERALIAPAAIVRHVGSVSSGGPRSAFADYHGLRNLIWTFIKTAPAQALPLALPWHGLAVLAVAARFALRGHGGAAWRAIRDGLSRSGELWAERKRHQPKGAFRRWTEAVSFSLTAPALRAMGDKPLED